MDKYPKLVIDQSKLADNIRIVCERLEEKGIELTAIVKGMHGIPELLDVYDASSCDRIGSSRLEQLKEAKEHGIKKPLVLIRIPMISEAGEVVKYADYSLNSENDVLIALNEEAEKQGKTHKVILMAEMGDLREGYVESDLVDAALLVENELKSLELSGIAMNVGCYGSILPTREKLDAFVSKAKEVEEAIGRKLEIVSGGATSSFVHVVTGDIPEGITDLRIGEAILVGRDTSTDSVFSEAFGVPLSRSVFRLEAEIIELKEKPTLPDGEVGHDAFGRVPEYEDNGIRKRALIAVGKYDYVDPSEIMPVEKGIKVIGASGDHTILDIEDAEKEHKVGDILEFHINYVAMLYLTGSINVKREFI